MDLRQAAELVAAVVDIVAELVEEDIAAVDTVVAVVDIVEEEGLPAVGQQAKVAEVQ